MLANLKTNSDLHVKRKLFHFGSVFSIFLCMTFLSPQTNWLLYVLIGVPGLLIDVLRLNSSTLNRFALKALGPVIRKAEIRQISGASYAILSVGIVYCIFPKPIAQLSTLFLAVGDPIASFFGLLFGKHIILGKKSLEGFMAAFIFCSTAAFLFILLQAPNQVDLIAMSLICGLVGALAELIPIGKLDDNLTQPLLSGALLILVFSFFGGL